MEYKELYNTDFEEFYENEEAKEGFKIDTPELASWACKIVAEGNEELAEFETMVKSEIELLNAKLTDKKAKVKARTSYLTSKLNDYLDIAPSRRTKTQVKLSTPHGDIVRTLPKWKFASLNGTKELKNDISLLEWAKANAPEYVKTTEYVEWGELKKRFQLDGNGIVDKETGEFIDCLGAELTPEKIEVK